MTATRTSTRTDTSKLRPVEPRRKSRWLPGGHWWLDNPRAFDFDRF